MGKLLEIENRTAEHVAGCVADNVVQLPADLVRFLTGDKGAEMAVHTAFSVATGMPAYFYDSHAPWQQGAKRNWNGLVRQSLPKAPTARPSSSGPPALDA